MKITDLISKKYYCVINNDKKIYFKYKTHHDDLIYNYGYIIIEYIDGYTEFHYTYEAFGTLNWFEEIDNCYEIDIILIGKYLPNDHPDKRNFKIKSILNEH